LRTLDKNVLKRGIQRTRFYRNIFTGKVDYVTRRRVYILGKEARKLNSRLSKGTAEVTGMGDQGKYRKSGWRKVLGNRGYGERSLEVTGMETGISLQIVPVTGHNNVDC